MYISKKKIIHGFSLLELILIITLTSIIAVPILSRLIISEEHQKVTIPSSLLPIIPNEESYSKKYWVITKSTKKNWLAG